MKAFKLIREICIKGLDNSCMVEYKHKESRTLQDYFGDYKITGKVLEEGEELLAICGDENGNSRIEGIADVVLTSINNANDKIYLYTIE